MISIEGEWIKQFDHNGETNDQKIDIQGELQWEDDVLKDFRPFINEKKGEFGFKQGDRILG